MEFNSIRDKLTVWPYQHNGQSTLLIYYYDRAIDH